MRDRLAELIRFGSVGGVAFVVDVGLFNLLCFGPGTLLGGRPLAARLASAAVATTVAWIGNRYWTFAQHRTEDRAREFVTFAVMNVVGTGISLGTLAFSHYVLDLRTPLADNVANILGIGLGTIFRYIAYRAWVFTASGAHPAAAPARHDARAARQDDVRVEAPRHSGQEDGEDGWPTLGELEPTAVGGDEVAGQRQAQARPGA